MGKSSLALAEDSEAILVRISGGIHVDLAAGILRFFVSESQVVEVHADEATIRSQRGQSADATVAILSAKVLLQVDARRGV